MSSSSLTVRSNWAAKTAADSSNLGTVIGLKGATRDFPIRNAQWILSSTSTNLRYVTAPYAFCDASAKLCNSVPKTGRSDASVYRYQGKIGQLTLPLLPPFTITIADWIVPPMFLSFCRDLAAISWLGGQLAQRTQVDIKLNWSRMVYHGGYLVCF